MWFFVVNLAFAAEHPTLSKKNLHYFEGTDAMIETALKDESHRIDAEFQVPEILKKPVRFWMKIYTHYSSQQIVLYDSSDMDVIYDVIDIRVLHESKKSAILKEIQGKSTVKNAVARLKNAIIAAAAHKEKPKNIDEALWQKVCARVLGHEIHVHALVAAVKSMPGQRDFIIRGLFDAEGYFPKLEYIFNALHVPKELTRLALVESSFNIKAYSKVGAAGVWQFMPRSSRDYLLISDELSVDERLSPLKSSVAAAKLLKWNYKFTGAWPLAIISYNHGHKGLPRFQPAAYQFDKIAYLFTPEKSPLGWASQNYYSEFLAVTHAEAYREIFYGEVPKALKNFVTIERLTHSESALRFIADKRLSVPDFKLFNYDVRDLKRPLPRGYWLAVPSNKDHIEGIVHFRPLHLQHKKHHA